MGARDDATTLHLEKIGDALGDATRRAILQYMLDLGEPASAAEVGEVFGVHRTVARGHLEKLLSAGVLRSGKRPSATGYGRPIKTYVSSGDRLELVLPPRRYESLARLLLYIVKQLLPTPMAVEHARTAGYEYGVSVRRDLQGADAGHMSPAAACAWLRQEGYGARCEEGPDGDVYVFDNCVYREIAADNTEVACAFSRGMLCGLIGAAPDALTQTNDMVHHGFCRHVIKR